MIAAKEAVIAAKDQTLAAKEEVIVALQERLNRQPWWRRILGVVILLVLVHPPAGAAEKRYPHPDDPSRRAEFVCVRSADSPTNGMLP